MVSFSFTQIICVHFEALLTGWTAEITKTILERLPELHWDALQMVFPGWADIVNNGALGPEFKL